MVKKFIDDGLAWHEPPFTPEEDRDYRRRTAGDKIAILRPSRAQRRAAEGLTTDPNTTYIRFRREPPTHPSAHDRDVIMHMVYELTESFVPEGEWLSAETEHRTVHIQRRLNIALGLPPDDPVEVAPPGFNWTPPFVPPGAASERTAKKPRAKDAGTRGTSSSPKTSKGCPRHARPHGRAARRALKVE